jgi:pimeloyl-ACP methyl ester carboxylesterase
MEPRLVASVALRMVVPLLVLLLLLPTALFVAEAAAYHYPSATAATVRRSVPRISPVTGLPNLFYAWKGQEIRYQVSGNEGDEPILLVHGLFVNSDHWRKALTQLNRNNYDKSGSSLSRPRKRYRIYALDLFGCGYSDKPLSNTDAAQRCNGETRRFRRLLEGITPAVVDYPIDASDSAAGNPPSPSVLKNVPLCSADGETIRIRDIDLNHPVGSPYNFFTWSDLITDFCRDVVVTNRHPTVALVSNSIGSIAVLQAVMDAPDLYSGVFAISPNYRELHSAEVPIPSLTMPVLRAQQRFLRDKGKFLYDTLAVPRTVKRILRVPYAVREAVDDALVNALLDPLLTPGAMEVVFDTLSYSAGPLPEQQLQMFPPDKPVWVCYGKADPWTPWKRVEAMARLYSPPVELVVGWEGVGHCPHDEAPELVHPLLLKFLDRVGKKTPAA